MIPVCFLNPIIKEYTGQKTTVSNHFWQILSFKHLYKLQHFFMWSEGTIHALWEIKRCVTVRECDEQHESSITWLMVATGRNNSFFVLKSLFHLLSQITGMKGNQQVQMFLSTSSPVCNQNTAQQTCVWNAHSVFFTTQIQSLSRIISGDEMLFMNYCSEDIHHLLKLEPSGKK